MRLLKELAAQVAEWASYFKPFLSGAGWHSVTGGEVGGGLMPVLRDSKSMWYSQPPIALGKWVNPSMILWLSASHYVLIPEPRVYI